MCVQHMRELSQEGKHTLKQTISQTQSKTEHCQQKILTYSSTSPSGCMHSSLHSDDLVQRHREEHDLILRFSSSFSNAIVGRLNVCGCGHFPSRLAHTAGSFFSWGLAPSTPLDLGEGCRMAAARGLHSGVYLQSHFGSSSSHFR